MTKYQTHDPYIDSETGILKNKLGIKDEKELKSAEASIVAWRSFQLFLNPIKGALDLEHLQAIHQKLFGDLYEWAGELRTIDLSKDDSYFANHTHIAQSACAIFGKLAEEAWLEGLYPAEFSERAAYYLGEINALHPFREGNGRAQREFINHLARKNGYSIDWKNITPEDMVQASIESFHHGDHSKFSIYIFENIRKTPDLEIVP